MFISWVYIWLWGHTHRQTNRQIDSHTGHLLTNTEVDFEGVEPDVYLLLEKKFEKIFLGPLFKLQTLDCCFC